MPKREKTPAILCIALIVAAILIPATISADPGIGQWISTTTSVSGQAVINESVTLKMVTYDGGLPDKQEWKFQSTMISPARSTWDTSLFLGTRDSVLAVQYSRTGIFSPFSFRS